MTAHTPKLLAALLLATGLCSWGCAGKPLAPELDVLKKKIRKLTEANEANQQQIEELSTRLFLLEDKVDTEKVARESSGKRPRLPVIRIKPTGQAGSEWQESKTELGQGAVTQRTPQGTGSGGDSVVESQDVVYSGEARHEGPRPVLRLYGADGGGRSGGGSGSGSLPALEPLPTTERLPVVPIPKGPAPVRGPGAAVAGEKQLTAEYQRARELYLAGKFDEAAKAFSRFSEQYANHPFTDNALYWLGECYYDTGDYRKALATFRDAVERFPAGNKAPDALYKMALCYEKMNEKKNARSVLAQVIETYPKSSVAQIASETLAKMQ